MTNNQFQKNILFCIFLYIPFFISAQTDSEILMTVGDNEVNVGEFKYIYEKNNGKNADYSKASLDEYIDLYTKFKLKVLKAKEMQLDTIVSLQKELDGYRNQLANSFLTDRKVYDKLIQEVYDRKKEDVKARHILIKVNKNGPNKQKVEAVKKLANIKTQLLAGKSFKEMAKMYSQDNNSKNNGGSLGWLTANLPNGFYQLENAIYNLNPGEVSDPIETKLGYHIIKIDKKRPARGIIEVAQIYLKIDKDDKKSEVKMKAKMDSLYQLLESGGKFDLIARQYSHDKTTMAKGGRLPAFGIGMYGQEFEDAAFGLKNNGDMTKPFKTSVGMHIIKRLNKPAPQTIEEIRQFLKPKLVKYDRYDQAQADLISTIKDNSKFTEDSELLQKFTSTLDENFYSYKWKPSKDRPKGVLLSFGPKDNIMLDEFTRYCKRQTRQRSQYDKTKPIQEAVASIYEGFVKEKAFKYEQKNLESKYPEFKSLMREYSEGILLFEATKINVWDKANQDTIGLYKFYENNKSNYIYKEQAKLGTYKVNSIEKKQVEKVMKYAKKKSSEKTLKKFNKDGKEMVEYDEITVEPGSKELAGLQFKKKSMTEALYDELNKKSMFRKVIEILPSRRKTLKEARGYVVADYQDKLEREWLIKLKKDYPISINDSVVAKLTK